MNTQLLYVSSAAYPMSREDLTEIIEGARMKNYAQNITGLLLYSAGQFMQLLEGEPSNVIGLYERIRIDKRHNNINRLYLGSSSIRLFPQWSMGVLDLNGYENVNVDAIRAKLFDPVMGEDAESGATGSRLIDALREFRNQLPAPDAEAIGGKSYRAA